jgi:hypothetical protein
MSEIPRDGRGLNIQYLKGVCHYFFKQTRRTFEIILFVLCFSYIIRTFKIINIYSDI